MEKLVYHYLHQFSSVQFSHSVVSKSLQPHESQHARPPCPSPTPRVHSDSHSSSQWYHPAISSSVIPFSCPQFLQASESFPMSQLFPWGGQSTELSALASFLPKKSQGWSLSEWTGWISLQSRGFSRVFSNTTVQKHQFFSFTKYQIKLFPFLLLFPIILSTSLVPVCFHGIYTAMILHPGTYHSYQYFFFFNAFA